MMASSSSLGSGGGGGVLSTNSNRSLRISKFSRRRSSISSDSVTSSQTRRILCFVLLFTLAVTVITNVYPQFISYYTRSGGDVVAKRDEKIVTLPLHPQMEKIKGQEHYFLLPSYVTSQTQQPSNADQNATTAFTSKTPTPIHGVLIYLHACHQSGLDVFHLPESRIVIYDALQKGLAVLAPTSADRESKCFSYRDLDSLPQIVEEWTNHHKLQNFPRMGMGESSGGSFLFFVFKELRLRSMAVYNTPQMFLEDEWKFAIPTALLTMPLDDPVASRMTRHFQKLQQHNVSTKLYKVAPRPFTESLCASRFPEWPQEFCQQLFSSMDSTLFNADGFVQGNVQQSPSWSKFFQSIETKYNAEYLPKNGKKPLVYDTSKAGNDHSWVWAVVAQEVQTCQGHHAMTADFHEEIFQFLLNHANISAI
ncbi:hypothetical protein IV203_038227 [Nitzschia inconspicua]|uniref:Uncharacterized protein n=1 Tax=Nitzschia inconspicua TaxID=303405 RepID=A0A9K3Q1P8_9STRA|nr:hypothetical protein IV203_038227 [Nitzschia inconspicua]